MLRVFIFPGMNLNLNRNMLCSLSDSIASKKASFVEYL